MLSLPSDDPGQPGPVDYMDQLLDNSVGWVGKGMPDIKNGFGSYQVEIIADILILNRWC
jgi:hypothetical protein